ncbi:MAG: L-malate glycosyltransferase [Candidatus Sumerlaeota bacterium]|nr:L-malate glycosyltransferase [Candidatus Sumerlaeota bacterium]
MRIALLANAANRHTHRWATWLAARGHDVRVFSDETPGAALEYGAVRVVPPEWSMLRLAYTFKIGASPYANNREKWHAYKRALRAWKPDVLHAHEALAYGPMLPHFPEFPRVLTPWGGDMASLGGSDAERAKLVLAACGAADVIATNAPGFEESWAAASGVEIECFHLFSWGVDLETFKRSDAQESKALLEKVAPSLNSGFVFSPRSAQRHYGIEAICEGWKRAETGLPLLVLRGGAREEEWRAVRERVGSDERVVLAEHVFSPREMALLYGASSAVLSVPERDLLSMTALEALACGAVLIQTRLPSYVEAMRGLDEEEDSRLRGLLIEKAGTEQVAEVIRRAVALPREERKRLAAHNRAVIERDHDWQKQAPRMEDVYAVAKKRHGGRLR